MSCGAREVVSRFHLLYAYCLMGNHLHLVLETPESNLSDAMRQLNGVYPQAFNHRLAESATSCKAGSNRSSLTGTIICSSSADTSCSIRWPGPPVRLVD